MNNRLHPRARFNRAVISTIAAGACVLLGAAPVQAATITFESQIPAAYDSGVTLNESGYNMLLIEGPVAAYYGGVGATGTIVDGSDPFFCTLAGCPVGNTSHFLAVLNDGGVNFSRAAAGGFRLAQLDFGFIAPVPVPAGDYGQVQLAGTTIDGALYSAAFDFPGQDVNGNFTFGTEVLDPAFRALVFTSLTVNACLFDDIGACVNSFDQPARNQAQFALDNVVLNEVPEPASFLLAGLGMAALGWSRRRAPRANAAVKGA